MMNSLAEAAKKGIDTLFKYLRENIEKLNLSNSLKKEIFDYLKDREDRVLELFKREHKIFEISRGVYRIEFKSRLAIEKRVETYAIVKDLAGVEKVVRTGRVPVEQAVWTTIIGVNALKCNCPDSLFNTWRAIRGLRRVNRRLAEKLSILGLFDKFNLCKHTLYILGLSIGLHGLKPYSRHVEVLKLEIIGVVIHSLKTYKLTHSDIEAIEKLVSRVIEEMETG